MSLWTNNKKEYQKYLENQMELKVFLKFKLIKNNNYKININNYPNKLMRMVIPLQN